jgi:hypothetical protein
MTTPPESHSATALARRNAGLDAMPPALRQIIEERRMLAAAAYEISKLSWGKALEERTARSIVSWGREYGIDPLTELDLLGGKLYKNATYYARKLAEMVEAGLVEYFYPDYVHVDARLEKLAEKGKQETERRATERIKHGIPEAAVGACVFHVKLKGLSEDVTGKNWCGGGTRKNDPVGDAEPVKTAETRAMRRAIRLVATRSKVFEEQERRSDVAFEGIAVEVAADHARLEAGPQVERPVHDVGGLRVRAGEGFVGPHVSDPQTEYGEAQPGAGSPAGGENPPASPEAGAPAQPSLDLPEGRKR